jgi:cell division protein FtsI (penicillin-binding protein 3)
MKGSIKWRDIKEHIIVFLIKLVEKSRQLPLPQVIRGRLAIAFVAFTGIFSLISIRLLNVMLFYEPLQGEALNLQDISPQRGMIIDRRGEILATQVTTASIYADPRIIANPKEACEKICKALPSLNYEKTFQKLSSGKAFVWLHRHATPKQQYAINFLGLPGIYLKKDARRIYPFASTVAHAVGYCDIDGKGLAGIERSFDKALRENPHKTVQLSIDIRLQSHMADILSQGVAEYKAKGGNAMIMDLHTGEIITMVSVPTFNPNHPGCIDSKALFNANTLGVNEPGSIAKVINAAIALESKKATLNKIYDATHPVKIGRFSVGDYRGKKRPLSVSEGFVYSSNIVSIKMACDFGRDIQKKYLEKLGFLTKPRFDIREVGAPIVPQHYSDATMMTLAYGYGIAVSPLQSIAGLGAVINEGIYQKPTLLKQHKTVMGERIFSKDVSKKVRALMRMVVLKGTGQKVDIEGLEIFGKTGTAEKVSGKGYSKSARNTFFIGGFPYHTPRYLLLVMLDDPQSTNRFGFTTAGWNVAYVAKKMLQKMATFFHYVPAPVIQLKKRDELIQTRYYFETK